MNFLRCAAVVLMLAPTLGQAQDFDAGLRAANAGDYATAFREWRPLAEKGHSDAQASLGLLYVESKHPLFAVEDGKLVIVDSAEKARWTRAAAEQGDASAQFILGNMYFSGNGVPQDYVAAAHWNRAAAKQGHAFSQANLGLKYHEGQGVLQDYIAAHMWFNIAGANGIEGARTSRDSTARRMTAEAIAEAQRRARVCMASNYQDCD